jgi:aspartate aminotransferase
VSRAELIGTPVPASPTLAANERVQAKLAAGDDVLHLAFGEAGLPVLPAVAEKLAEGAARNGYGPVAGSPAVREAAAGYFARRGLPTEAGQIVVAPGSKPLLYSLLQLLPGDVVLPVPCWVSYGAHAAIAGKRVIGVPAGEVAGGVPDPSRLRAALAEAEGVGARPGVLVLTMPDNPTGTVAPAEVVREVCEIADAAGLLIVCDEIYRDLAHEPASFVSPAALLPARTFVTTGLSKHLALGGWRVGLVRLAGGPLGEEAGAAIAGLASEIWSALAAPMQHAAAYVLSEPPEVVEHVDASRRLHRAVVRAVYEIVMEAGARCRPPSGAFYLYPDFAGRPFASGAELAEHLLEERGIAVLAGEAFGDDPAALRFRIATSLLYGADDDQRWEALRADDPTALPWIAAALERMREGLTAPSSSR